MATKPYLIFHRSSTSNSRISQNQLSHRRRAQRTLNISYRQYILPYSIYPTVGSNIPIYPTKKYIPPYEKIYPTVEKIYPTIYPTVGSKVGNKSPPTHDNTLGGFYHVITTTLSNTNYISPYQENP
jgi:hypothetical protein